MQTANRPKVVYVITEDKQMKKAICEAVAECDRIQLVIRKGDPGYKAFAHVLREIDIHGCMSWYGDITNTEGKEQSGLIITFNK